MAIGDFYFHSCTDASVSLHSFCVGVFTCFPAVIFLESLMQKLLLTVVFALFLAGIISVTFSLRSFHYYAQNGQRAFFIGIVFSCGFLVFVFSQIYWSFGLYLCILASFHWSEFYVTAMTNPSTLKLSSYLLDHSTAYHLAALLSWCEFWIEVLLFPQFKTHLLFIILGVCICIGGELIRKGAMVTCGTNFNHVIEHRKRATHVLVKHGLYSYVRHPSYTGWFLWAIGTQILLSNPVAVLVYTVASWRFFSERIVEEELCLINFFGQDYLEYQRTVPSGIPFVKGYSIGV